MRLSDNIVLIFSSLILLGACSDSSDPKPNEPLPVYDFSEVDARLQQFIDDSDQTEGISITIVDRVQGAVHEAAFGDHPENIVVMLASVSKFPSVTLLMSIDEDLSVDFDIEAPIKNYLAWEGVYGEATTAQLLSNISGIPGIFSANAQVEYACQYDPDYDFEECAKLIYSTELPDSPPPGSVFDYGGAQWHLAGAIGAQATNNEWSQAFDEYVAEPCELEDFKYGNTAQLDDFTGYPDDLVGTGNPHAGGGAIASMTDMAKLLLLHVREGKCDDKRVLSEGAVQAMQVNRIEGLINPVFPDHSYGMGWWGRDDLPESIYFDAGAYGSVAWIDTQRMIGGFIAIDDYSSSSTAMAWDLVLDEVIPLVGKIVDDSRNAVAK